MASAAETREVEEVGMDIAKLVKTKQLTDPSSTEASEDSMKIHIWDFAGQELYYTTHQVIIDLVLTSFRAKVIQIQTKWNR